VTEPRHPTARQDAGSDPDPDAVAAAVSACPAVVGLCGGRFGEIATYLPGRRVSGVRITPGQVEVHVIGRLGVPIREIADQIRAALNPVAPHHSVLVAVDDLDLDAEPVDAPASGDGAVPPAPASAHPPPTRSELS